MSVHEILNEPHLMAAQIDLQRRFNFHVTLGDDFRQYSAIIAKGRAQQPVGLPFDPGHSPIDAGQGFWLVGHTPDGVLAHTQAMRVIDNGSSSLGEYMLANFRRYPPAGVALDLARSRFRAGPGPRQINGKICYHGEFWLDRTRAQLHGTGLSGALARFAFMVALSRLSPDCVFGFMPNAVACKGFAARQGYMHAEPGAVRWQRQDEAAGVIEGFLVYMRRVYLTYFLSIPAQDMAA